MSFLGRTPKCGSRGTVQRCCPSGTSEITQSFRARDADGDGFLTLEEYSVGRARGRERNDDTRRLDKAIFDAYDADGDGRLSLAEYTKLFTEVNGDVFISSKLIFESADADGDGMLNEAEHDAAIRSRFNEGLFPFDRIDTDVNGGITLLEFRRAGFGVPVDRDGDGRIDRDEFMANVIITIGRSNEAAALFDAQTQADGTTTVSLDDAAQLWATALSSSLRPNSDAADTDGDGLITKDEFIASNSDLPPDVLREQTTLFFDFDTDGDMKVGFDEVLAVLGGYNPFSSKTRKSRRSARSTAAAAQTASWA
jgi:Ca2+-binding EF-hand superfamily protein